MKLEVADGKYRADKYGPTPQTKFKLPRIDRRISVTINQQNKSRVELQRDSRRLAVADWRRHAVDDR